MFTAMSKCAGGMRRQRADTTWAIPLALTLSSNVAGLWQNTHPGHGVMC